MNLGFAVIFNVACFGIVFSVATATTLQKQLDPDCLREGQQSLLNERSSRKLRGNQHPMISAAVRGDDTTLQLYLDSGVDVDVENNLGWTALSAASAFNRLSTAKIIIDYGADVNHRSVESNSALTPLMIASIVGDGEIIGLLLKSGADPMLTSSQGEKAEGLLCMCTQIELAENLPSFCNFEGCEDLVQLWGSQIKGAPELN